MYFSVRFFKKIETFKTQILVILALAKIKIKIVYKLLLTHDDNIFSIKY